MEYTSNVDKIPKTCPVIEKLNDLELLERFNLKDTSPPEKDPIRPLHCSIVTDPMTQLKATLKKNTFIQIS